MTGISSDRPLLVGAVLGDSEPDSMQWSAEIGALSQECDRLSAEVRSPLRLNVVFHVDGRLIANEFVGVRTGRFTKAKSLLVVQCAVEGPSDDKRATLLAQLDRAVDEAERFAVRKRIASELPELRALIRQVAKHQ